MYHWAVRPWEKHADALKGGLDRPTEGRAFIDGAVVTRLSNSKLAELRAEKIGFRFPVLQPAPKPHSKGECRDSYDVFKK